MDEKLKKALAEEGAELVDLFSALNVKKDVKRPIRDYGVNYSKIVGISVKSKGDMEDIINRLSYLRRFTKTCNYDDGKDIPWRVLDYLAVHHGIETLAAVVNAAIVTYGKERVLSLTDIRGVLEQYDILRDY